MKKDHQEKPGGSPSVRTDDKKKKEAAGKQRQEPKGLAKEDLPDSTNESTGKMGSGQRQDSN